MSDNDLSAADPLGQIADEFVEAIRQGQRPSIEEFARRYPAHADDLRDMLPALVLMEQAKSAADTLKEQLSGVKVYVVGDEAEKEVYLVGKTKAGQWAGLKATVVESCVEPQQGA
jgi:hypothetical protein